MRIMSTLKLLFSKITDDAPVYEKKDVVENIFVFRMLFPVPKAIMSLPLSLPSAI